MSTSLTGVTTNYFPSPQNGFTTTTAGSVASGAATVTLNSVAGYTNGQIAVMVIDPSDSSKKQTFLGVVDTAGVQLTSVKWTAGTNQTHALGATVVDYATATHIGMMTKGLLAAGLLQTGLMTPKIQTSINDSGGNEAIRIPATASAVNDITVTNAIASSAPSISATGDDTAINLNLRGKGLAKTVNIGAGAVNIFPYDYVASGCVITADAAGSTRLATMTSGVVVINGNPITVAASTSRTYTASKDVYVDVLDNGDGTGLLVFTDNTTNAASPALAANSIRLGIVVVGAGNIAAAASINQGQEDRVLPIASSIPYAVTDSLGNLICPRDPNRKILGFQQITSNFTTTTTGATEVDVTGLSVPCIVPANRKIKITAYTPEFDSSAAAGQNIQFKIKEGASTLNNSSVSTAVASRGVSATVEYITTPSAGLHTYKVTILQNAGAGTMTFSATAFLKVELL